jgi:hypothetical protein
MNLTAVDTKANQFGGYVTVYPCASTAASERPEASSLNFVSGQTLANSVVTPLSSDGHICLYVYGIAHLLVDVNGYYAALAASVDTYTRDEVDEVLAGSLRRSDVEVFAEDPSGRVEAVYVVGEFSLAGGRRATVFDYGEPLSVFIDGVHWQIFADRGIAADTVGYLYFRNSDCSGSAYGVPSDYGDGWDFARDVLLLAGLEDSGIALVFDSQGEGGIPIGARRVGYDGSDTLTLPTDSGSYIGLGRACYPGVNSQESASSAYRLEDLGPPPLFTGPLEFVTEG